MDWKLERCHGRIDGRACRFVALHQVVIDHTVVLTARLCSYHRQLMRHKAESHHWRFSAKRMKGAPKGNPLHDEPRREDYEFLSDYEEAVHHWLNGRGDTAAA